MLVVLLAECHLVQVDEGVGISERSPVVSELGVLGRAHAPLDALVEAALPVLDARSRELELHAAPEAVAGGGVGVDRIEPALVPVERFRIVAEPLAKDSPPCASVASEGAPSPADSRARRYAAPASS